MNNLQLFNVAPSIPAPLKFLESLAYNLWCTWDYDAIRLFYRIDAQLFRAVNHNLVRFLLSLPTERVSELATDRGFQHELEKVWEKFQEYMQYDGQFKTSAGGAESATT